MNTSNINPFNITKAVDFTDQEINDYWVDIPAGAGFADMAKPTSPMPMLILGGKGSGKTHLMRHFSYPLQRIRHGQDVIGGIQSDGYIGIYLRCGGLNSARFKDKGQQEETWAEVFAYYMELWLSQLVLSTVGSAVTETDELGDQEREIVAQISRRIDLRGKTAPDSWKGLLDLLADLQRELDAAINNCAITRSLPVHVAVTRGDLVFGVPQILSAALPSFRECLFLYLIDEFENLSASQQKYVNTLLRERVSPCTFKVGARMYGVRTYSTYSADEENKEGSEFEVLRLDALLRDNDQYGSFARRLIARRLTQHGHIPSDVGTLEALATRLDQCFEEPPKSTRFSSSETAYVIEKYKGRERPYFKALRQHLERAIRTTAAPGLKAASDVESVVGELACGSFPLLEKLNCFLLYKEWYSGRNLLDAAREIAAECREHVDGTAESSRYKRTLNHFKADLLAQLLRETDQRQRYVGLETFIDISSGLPRNLLILLKHIFAWGVFNGEQPFKGTPISVRSQQAGVMEASEWFYRDARMIGTDGQAVIDAINRLGTLFRGIRFSEKPSECSCSTFSTNLSEVSKTARSILDIAEKWSLLIDVGGQRDRNTDRIDAKYQMNRMLAPRWDLAIFRRGVLALAATEVNAIFDPGEAAQFDAVLKARVDRMTAPHFGKRDDSPAVAQREETGLFQEGEHD